MEDAGWTPVSVVPDAARVAAMTLEGAKGTEYWLGMHNFYVITTYNRSKLYAMAVYQLARDVKSGYKTAVPEINKTIAEHQP